VDVIVPVQQVEKAVGVLRDAIPDLEPRNSPLDVRLLDRSSSNIAINVIKPWQQPYREVVRNTHSVSKGGEAYRVPSLEMAIVMKFAAMTSWYRADRDKPRDAHDFTLLVNNNPGFNRAKLAELANLLHTGGGKYILQMARKVQVGETLRL
jgi:hypothetical protein